MKQLYGRQARAVCAKKCKQLKKENIMEAREKEYLDGLFEKARKAQIEMEFFSQEQTDKLVKAIGNSFKRSYRRNRTWSL